MYTLQNKFTQYQATNVNFLLKSSTYFRFFHTQLGYYYINHSRWYNCMTRLFNFEYFEREAVFLFIDPKNLNDVL